MEIVQLKDIDEFLSLFRLKDKQISVKIAPGNNDFYHEKRKRLDAQILGIISSNIKCNIVEIGTSKGFGTYNIAINTNSNVWTVNIHPDDTKESGKFTTHFPQVDEIGYIYRSDGLSNIIQILKNTKHWNPSEDDIKNLDMIYIDGCHDSDFVYNDTKKLLKFINEDGFILWHDFCPELRSKFPHIDSVMEGIERLFNENILIGTIYTVKGSWIGVFKFRGNLL